MSHDLTTANPQQEMLGSGPLGSIPAIGASHLGNAPALTVSKSQGLGGRAPPKGHRKGAPCVPSHRPTMDEQRDAIAAQERLVATLREQKVQRDAQMAMLKEAFMAMGATYGVAGIGKAVSEQPDSPLHGEEDGDAANTSCTASCGGELTADGAERDSPARVEMSPERSAATATAVASLLTALGAYVTGRERDAAEREAMGFAGEGLVMQEQTATLAVGSSSGIGPHVDPCAVVVGEGPQSSLDDDMRLLREEEEAVLELVAYRQQQREDEERRRAAKKERKQRKADAASNQILTVCPPLDPNGSNSSHVSEVDYEDDFESDAGDEAESAMETELERTRAEVIGRLLEEYASGELSSSQRKPVGLSWLEEEE